MVFVLDKISVLKSVCIIIIPTQILHFHLFLHKQSKKQSGVVLGNPKKMQNNPSWLLCVEKEQRSRVFRRSVRSKMAEKSSSVTCIFESSRLERAVARSCARRRCQIVCCLVNIAVLLVKQLYERNIYRIYLCKLDRVYYV